MVKTLDRLQELIKKISIDEKTSNGIFEEVSVQIRKGLVMHCDNPSGFDFSKSDFMMLDSGVEHAPSGQERGVYYGIDMGGTNVRAIRAVLVGNSRVESMSEEAMSLLDVPYAKHLPKGVLDRQATASELFDGVVYVVKKLMERHGEYDEQAAVRAQENAGGKTSPSNIREVGFTCSFGINQRSLHSAILTQWSKAIETGEAAERVEDQVIGRDVCALINQAFVRNKINARVNCILNDTISTLISGAFSSTDAPTAPSSPAVSKDTSSKPKPPCMIGAIIGTGFNVCYYEPEANLYNYVGRVINTECGGLKRAFPRVAADALVDFNSSNPGRQVVEKAVSGLYLGEVVRNMLIEVLQVEAPRQLWQPNVVSTQQVAKIFNLKPRENAPSGSFGNSFPSSSCGSSSPAGEDINEFNVASLYTEEAHRIVEEWLDRKPSNEELIVIKKICDAVLGRSARIVGSLLAAFVTKTNHSNGVTIGCDGSLFTKNPKYQDIVNDTVQQIVGNKINVVLTPVNGGSCIGAALLAACTARHSTSHY